MNFDSSKFDIEKLNGSNYAAWKFKIRLLLVHKDLWNVVEGPIADQDKSNKALALIGLSVKDSQIVHIQNCLTAKDAWEKLSKLYENTGTANKMHLQEDLMMSKMSEFDSAQDHIEKLRRIVGQLGALGMIVSDDQYKIALLRSLPKSYESLVITLENMVDNLSIEDIHARIIREENRKKRDVEEIPTASKLFAASDKPMLSVDRKVIICHHCKKKGHKKADCWALQRQQGRYGYSRGRSSRPSRQPGQYDTDRGHAFTASKTTVRRSTECFIDSGASFHVTSEKSCFDSLIDIEPINIEIADGTFVQAKQSGNLNARFLCLNQVFNVTLQKVLYIPDMKVNLLSVSAIQENGYTVIFKNDCCTITRNSDGACALRAHRTRRSYSVTCEVFEHAFSATTGTSSKIWHNRMGHPGKSSLLKLESRNLIQITSSNRTEAVGESTCTACLTGKMTRKSFPPLTSRPATKTLELVHSDLCGPMQTPSHGGSKYFMLIIDDLTRMTFVYFLRKKSESLLYFKCFVSEMEAQRKSRIQRLRTDNGGEYCGAGFQNYLKEKGIIHEPSAPYTPEQNGISERANRSVIEKARCMMNHARLSSRFWAEAVRCAVYLKNKTPTSALQTKIPEEEYTGKPITLNHLKVFGCLAYVHVPKERRTKWEDVSKPCVFVGYTATNKQFRFYDFQSRRLVISSSAVFMEEETCKLDESRNIRVEKLAENNIVLDEDVSENNPNTPEDPTDEEDSHPVPTSLTSPVGLRRSKRHSTPPKRLTYEFAGSDDDEVAAAMFSSLEIDVPVTVSDAMRSSDCEKWQKSMRLEYDALLENNTWDLVPLPEGKTAIPCKWIYKVKPKTLASPITYKSRLVAKGFKQRFGIDYTETFAPVVRMTAVRVLLAVSINLGLFLHQMDVKNAFLNGKLDLELYMEQPEGFESAEHPDFVCKLNKTVYGLKQSPRAWYHTISPVLESVGVTKSNADNGIFAGIVDQATLFIALYVDDLFIASSSMAVIEKIKAILASHFAMKDLGKISHCLGVQIEYSRESGHVLMSQEIAINGVLKKFNMLDCHGIDTPMEHKTVLFPHVEGSTSRCNAPYRQLVGCLMYIMSCTRPDISFSIGVLSKFLEMPTESHWKAAKRVLRYLKKTASAKLVYNSCSRHTLTGYSDADWASSFDRKSTTGYLMFLDSSLVSWSSKKQTTVALSSTEAEVVAATEATREIQWLKKLLRTFEVEVSDVTLYCDSQPAIAIANTSGYHGRSKHMDVKYMYLQDCVEKDEVQIVYCATFDMIADSLTKPLQRVRFQSFLKSMGLRQIRN